MSLLDFLFPPRCVFCRKPSESALCPDCQSDLPWITGQKGDGVLSPLVYAGPARKALHRFKFGGQAGYAGTFGLLMAQLLLDEGVKGDAVTWVPCSRARSFRRGYDQCRELAVAVGGVLRLPVEGMLVKTRHNKSQREMKDAVARISNVSGAFSARGKPAGRRIILVDDICTTGATLNECRSVLIKAGAAAVFCVTSARTAPGSDAR